MPDDVRRRALQPFFTTKGAKSTGLGLSVARGAIVRYGGTLRIKSTMGQGTTVTVSLPVAAPWSTEPSPAIAPSAMSLDVSDLPPTF
jgi:signal transduction histidine kinase